jgi:hypothetical protein
MGGGPDASKAAMVDQMLDRLHARTDYLRARFEAPCPQRRRELILASRHYIRRNRRRQAPGIARSSLAARVKQEKEEEIGRN